MRSIQEICADVNRTPQSAPCWPHLLKELREANELLLGGGNVKRRKDKFSYKKCEKCGGYRRVGPNVSITRFQKQDCSHSWVNIDREDFEGGLLSGGVVNDRGNI